VTELRWQLVRHTVHVEPADGPFATRSCQHQEVIASGTMPPTGDFTIRIALHVEGKDHPMVDVPFSFGAGHWIWVRPIYEPADDEEPHRPGEHEQLNFHATVECRGHRRDETVRERHTSGCPIVDA
jgi:hypothetical protein